MISEHWILVGFWAVLMVVMFVLELATTALVSLWFVGGGLAALILAWLGFPLWIQAVVFAGVSAVLFITCRDWLYKHFHYRLVPTNTDRLINALGTVSVEITPEQGGRVLVGGQDWKAVSYDRSRISKGDMIKVIGISGVTLTVMQVPDNPLERERK